MHRGTFGRGATVTLDTLSSTVSPLKSCNVSMVFRCSETTELSSLIASSTTRRLGDFFLSKIAVLKSFFSFPLLQCSNYYLGQKSLKRTSGWYSWTMSPLCRSKQGLHNLQNHIRQQMLRSTELSCCTYSSAGGLEGPASTIFASKLPERQSSSYLVHGRIRLIPDDSGILSRLRYVCKYFLRLVPCRLSLCNALSSLEASGRPTELMT